MAKSRFQLRGHCQRCGNQQAVMADGTMAHHGYTLKDGWFQGKCSGHQFQPVERSRATLDKTVEAIRTQVVELRAQADALNDKANWPATIMVRNRVLRQDEEVALSSLPAYEQDSRIRAMQYSLNRRAEIGEATATYMLQVADTFHGKDLIEVARGAGPERICEGERRVNNGIILECLRVERARVYYTTSVINPRTGRFNSSQTTTRAWRALVKVS